MNNMSYRLASDTEEIIQKNLDFLKIDTKAFGKDKYVSASQLLYLRTVRTALDLMEVYYQKELQKELYDESVLNEREKSKLPET